MRRVTWTTGGELWIGTGATPCGLGGFKAMIGVKMVGGGRAVTREPVRPGCLAGVPPLLDSKFTVGPVQAPEP